MATVLLVRHGRTETNAAGILAGRRPPTSLDEVGKAQAVALGEMLNTVDIVDVVSSPLERCVQTAVIATGREPRIDERLIDCDFGDWSGRTLDEIREDPLWQVVQTQPSAMVFPGGESLRAVQHRVVDAVRAHDARIAAEHGPEARWVAMTHADNIKMIAADALGMHLDQFQRIVVDNCSVTTITYGEHRPQVTGLNVRVR